MVNRRPKTPLLRTDGERGFVFYDSGKSVKKYEVKSGNMYNWQRTSRKSRYQVVETIGRHENQSGKIKGPQDVVEFPGI